FPGNYSDYRAYEDSKPKESKVKKEAVVVEVKKEKPKGQLTYNEKREYGTLESDIANLEKKKERIEMQFANGEVADEEINEVSLELQRIISEIDHKEERWFELSSKLEGES
ncbi:MAG: ABC transporter C-terminal domain-containing protein, partial [Flavicella sp.]